MGSSSLDDDDTLCARRVRCVARRAQRAAPPRAACVCVVPSCVCRGRVDGVAGGRRAVRARAIFELASLDPPIMVDEQLCCAVHCALGGTFGPSQRHPPHTALITHMRFRQARVIHRQLCVLLPVYTPLALPRRLFCSSPKVHLSSPFDTVTQTHTMAAAAAAAARVVSGVVSAGAAGVAVVRRGGCHAAAVAWPAWLGMRVVPAGCGGTRLATMAAAAAGVRGYSMSPACAAGRRKAHTGRCCRPCHTVSK